MLMAVANKPIIAQDNHIVAFVPSLSNPLSIRANIGISQGNKYRPCGPVVLL
jgi:hypothetical protein